MESTDVSYSPTSASKSTKKGYGIYIGIACILAATLFTISMLISNVQSDRDKKIYYMSRTGNAINFIPEKDTSSLKRTLPDRQPEMTQGIISIDSRLVTLNSNPKLLLWIMMMTIMTGTAIGMLPTLLNDIYILWNSVQPSVKEIVFSSSLIIIIILAALFNTMSPSGTVFISALEIAEKFNVLFYSTRPIHFIICIVTIIGGIALLGMFLVNSTINRVTEQENVQGEIILEVFNTLKESLKRFLSFISILIMFSIITTSLLEQSLQNVLKVNGYNLIPQEFIYAYGLVFSVLLAAVYIPIYNNLQTKGKILSERFSGDEENSGLSKDKIDLLVLKEGPLKNIQILLTILAPILSGIFSDVIKNFS